jgi:putative ABC transport system substrate-binding protein
MRRCEFITLVGSAVAMPLIAGAQQRERTRRIGVLMSVASDDPKGQTRFAAFRQGFQKLDWTEGQNVQIDTRWQQAMPTSIVDSPLNWPRSPNVILATASSTVAALHGGNLQ